MPQLFSKTLVTVGEHWMERCLRQSSQVFPGQALGLPTFSEEAAHQLLAAADYLVVPSRFEPCGLVAPHGQRYGAVPIVASVGGLKDVVTPEVRSMQCAHQLPGLWKADCEVHPRCYANQSLLVVYVHHQSCRQLTCITSLAGS